MQMSLRTLLVCMSFACLAFVTLIYPNQTTTLLLNLCTALIVGAAIA
jgi:hypothetical protein